MKWKLSARALYLGIVTLVLLGILIIIVRISQTTLRKPAFASGWFLFGVMVFLAAYNGRKKLAMIPLGKASTWLQLHVIGGFFALLVFWSHTGELWPRGGYERVLALLFYLVSLSGIFGWLLQMYFPHLMTDSGVEVIYERIPAELANLREQAEAIVLNCTTETGSPTLARHYVERVDWFLRQPRFFLFNAIGSEKARMWRRQQHAHVLRYLNSREQKFLNELTEIIDYKLELDVQYAAQTIMKRWLFLHVPLAMALMLMAVWHVIVVHVYTA